MRRLTWHNASQSDHHLREYLILALLRSRACVTLQDDELNYLFIANLPSIWSVPSGDDPSDKTVFGPALGNKLEAKKASVVSSGEAETLEIGAFDNVFEIHMETIPALDDGVQVLTTIVDITETRRREQALKDLLLEVSHRSKNLLAIIQSIAAQTARYSGSLEQFQSEFRGRIFSLAKSQDLVTDADWYGVSVLDLARAQIELLSADRRTHIRFFGENIILTPNAALYLGLGFHELISNSFESGRKRGYKNISLSCHVTRENGEAMVEITWNGALDRSADGEVVSGKEKRPFLSEFLLQKIIPQSLNGGAEYSSAGGEEDYRLFFPHTKYSVRLELGGEAGVRNSGTSSNRD